MPSCRAARPPREENILYLNGENSGLVNNACFPSTVAPSYAPASQVITLLLHLFWLIIACIDLVCLTPLCQVEVQYPRI